MRVLIVTHGLFPGYVAPIPKECAKNLRRSGVDVEVLVVGGRAGESAAEPLAFPIHCVTPGSILGVFRAIRPLLASVDIVHYFPGKRLELMPLLARRPKYVFHLISVSITGRRLWDAAINLGKRLQPLFADHVIFTDQALATALKPIAGRSRSLFPVGYPDDLFYPSAPPPPSAEKRLLYHGAVRHERRLDDLVRTLARLPREFSLTVVGGGLPRDEAYRRYLADLATSLGCVDRLHLVNMPQAEIRAVIDRVYLCLSHVPMLECYQDQFVLKTIEYLACHRPVLATGTRYTTRFREEIGCDRILLTDGTVDDMAARIRGAEGFVTRFYAPDNLASLSAALAPYSFRHLVETVLLPTYASLMAQGGRPERRMPLERP